MATAKKKEEAKKEVLTYKGKPLVRRGNILYYGNVEDPYYVRFTINDSEMVENFEVANDVTIDLLENNGSTRPIRNAKRTGLYAAIDIGEYWLQDALDSTM